METDRGTTIASIPLLHTRGESYRLDCLTYGTVWPSNRTVPLLNRFSYSMVWLLHNTITEAPQPWYDAVPYCC